MTREEALAYAISQKAGLESELHRTPCGYGNWAVYSTVLDFINAAISALKVPTREQVEKMRGEWTTDGVCSRCGFDAMYYKGVPVQVRTNYCPACGAPLTDEAVDMVMERLEEVRNDQ